MTQPINYKQVMLDSISMFPDSQPVNITKEAIISGYTKNSDEYSYENAINILNDFSLNVIENAYPVNSECNDLLKRLGSLMALEVYRLKLK